MDFIVCFNDHFSLVGSFCAFSEYVVLDVSFSLTFWQGNNLLGSNVQNWFKIMQIEYIIKRGWIPSQKTVIYFQWLKPVKIIVIKSISMNDYMRQVIEPSYIAVNISLVYNHILKAIVILCTRQIFIVLECRTSERFDAFLPGKEILSYILL